MIYPIRYYGDPILRRVARPVSHFDDALKTLAKDMLETMYDANGAGLAAPQVGIGKRLFVALEIAPPEGKDEDDSDDSDMDALSIEEKRKRWGVRAEHVMVNPDITRRDGVQHGHDGCLSLPGLYVEKMPRDLRVHIRYQDIGGKHHERDAEGRFAHVLQHELDHLDGVLYFDRLGESERRSFMDEHRRELAEMQRDAKALLRSLKTDASPARR